MKAVFSSFLFILVVDGAIGLHIIQWIDQPSATTTARAVTLNFADWWNNRHRYDDQQDSTTTPVTRKLPSFLELATQRPGRPWQAATVSPSFEVYPTEGASKFTLPPDFERVTPRFTTKGIQTLYTLGPRITRVTFPHTLIPRTRFPFTMEPPRFTVPNWWDDYRIPRDPFNWFK